MFITLSFFSFKYIENIKADSGWDSDYDSSWDSGSDWGDSSWDNDYDYDYDYDSDYSSSGGSSGGSGAFDIVIILVFLFFMGLAIYVEIKKVPKVIKKVNTYTKNIQIKNKYNKHEFLTQQQVDSIIPNFDIAEFNFKAYQIFYDVQMAWMEFDYDKLKELVTDELYNSYVMQLDALKVKNQKNTMKGFELIESYLYDIKEENGIYIAKVYLSVRFYDYIENSKNGIILRGTADKKIHNTYELTFIKTKEDKNNTNICPRCSAPVEGNSTGVCEYCKSKLINETYDWILSKKEKIRQK